MSPVALSLLVGGAATLLSLPPAVGIAWLLERRRFPGRAALRTLVLLPVALPPVVTGYLLLWVFSPRRPLGRLLEAVGMPVAFHLPGAIAAAAVVGFPLLVLLIGVALRGVDPRLEAVSRTLGRGRVATFLRVTLPLAWPGVLAGALLGFARGLGEFGASIVLAGRIPGETETIPLAIYAALERPGGEREVVPLVLLSVAAAVAAVVLAQFLDGRFRARIEVPR